MHDQLVTQFQGGTAPDIIHDESADITGFTNQGYLADLSPYLSQETKDAVSAGRLGHASRATARCTPRRPCCSRTSCSRNSALLKQAGVTGDR